MRLALTGASGRIGKAFVERARKDGHSLVCLGRTFPSGLEDVAECHSFDLAQPYFDPSLVNALDGVDVAVHLAAVIDTDPQTARAALDMYKINVLGTGRMIDLLSKARVPHLVVASSANVYDPLALLADEDTPIRPISRTLYLGSKVAQEAFARECCRKRQMRCAIVRLSSVVGNGADIVSCLASKIARGERIVLANSEYGADFVSLADVVKGLILTAERKLEGDFNLSSGVRSELPQLIEMIGRRLSRTPLVEQGDTQAPKDKGFPAIDNSRLRAHGFLAEPLDAVLDRLVGSPGPDRSVERAVS